MTQTTASAVPFDHRLLTEPVERSAVTRSRAADVVSGVFLAAIGGGFVTVGNNGLFGACVSV